MGMGRKRKFNTQKKYAKTENRTRIVRVTVSNTDHCTILAYLSNLFKSERDKRIERLTAGFGIQCSTTELIPQ